MEMELPTLVWRVQEGGQSALEQFTSLGARYRIEIVDDHKMALQAVRTHRPDAVCFEVPDPSSHLIGGDRRFQTSSSFHPPDPRDGIAFGVPRHLGAPATDLGLLHQTH